MTVRSRASLVCALLTMALLGLARASAAGPRPRAAGPAPGRPGCAALAVPAGPRGATAHAESVRLGGPRSAQGRWSSVPAPVAYDIRLDPDLRTGVLRERAVVAIRNPARADSIELALNDWFEQVDVQAAGARATVRRRPGSVVIGLAPARPRETLCLELRGRPARSDDEQRSVLGRESVFLLWSDAFYPLDYDAWAPVRLAIALPAGFRVFGPGHEVRTETVTRPETDAAGNRVGDARDPGALIVHRFVSDHPLRLFSVLADRRWIETRRSTGGLRLRTLLYPSAQPYADSLLARSADVLSGYARLYGPYGFDEFTFATLDSLYARRALAGGVVYSPAFLEREMARVGYDGHETALLWWGYTIAGSGPGSFQWLEGLGDYAEYLYDEERGKPLPPSWARFRAAYLALQPGSEPPLAGLRGSTPQAIIHGKYPWLMHLLRFAVGDDAFRGAMRDLFERARYHALTLDQLVAALEAGTGRSLAWWKDGWLLRPSVPDVHFTATFEPEGDRWRVVARLEQATPPFSFPAEIGVFSGTARDLRRVQVDSATQTFLLTSATRPDSVVLDPRGWVIMRRH